MQLVVLMALAVLALGLLLIRTSASRRAREGLGSGETIALDDRVLHSERLKLAGRPDRIERVGECYIPEEWKSSKRLNEGHRLQLGTYFLLIEEVYGVRPPYGWVVLGDGSRVRVENSEELGSEVLAIADDIRRHRRTLRDEIPVRQPSWKCRVCGQRGNCRRARS